MKVAKERKPIWFVYIDFVLFTICGGGDGLKYRLLNKLNKLLWRNAQTIHCSLSIQKQQHNLQDKPTHHWFHIYIYPFSFAECNVHSALAKMSKMEFFFYSFPLDLTTKSDDCEKKRQSCQSLKFIIRNRIGFTMRPIYSHFPFAWRLHFMISSDHQIHNSFTFEWDNCFVCLSAKTKSHHWNRTRTFDSLSLSPHPFHLAINHFNCTSQGSK